MLSRALSLATVMLGIAVFAADDAGAKDLEAGKSAAQIFSGNCAACHSRGARGLLRTVPPGSLPAFLRQHYTTGPDMAGMLSAYLISSGAADQRYRAERPRSHPGDARQEPRQADRQGRKPPPQATQPDPAAQNEMQAGKDGLGRRVVRPVAGNSEAATRPASEETSAQGRRKPRDKKLGKQGPDESAKTGAAGQGASPHDSATKPETAKTESSDVTPVKKEEVVKETPKDEAPKKESAKEQADEKQPAPEQPAKPEAVKPDAPKPDPAQSASEKADVGKDGTDGKPGVDKLEAGKSGAAESGKPDSIPTAATPDEPKAPPLRADPVPAVTPAPKVGEGDARPPPEPAASSSAPPQALDR